MNSKLTTDFLSRFGLEGDKGALRMINFLYDSSGNGFRAVRDAFILIRIFDYLKKTTPVCEAIEFAAEDCNCSFEKARALYYKNKTSYVHLAHLDKE